MTQIHRLINSPNTVLANAMESSLDIFIPRLEINQPKELIFNVGTQINGIPHIGTYIVQAMSFVVAQKVRERFGVPVRVCFGALDNAPYELKDGANNEQYQIAFGHALKTEELEQTVQLYYINWMNELSKTTGVNYEVNWYKDSQATPGFRHNFLHTLNHKDHIRHCVAPSSGILRIRIPEPGNFFAEKYCTNTQLLSFDTTGAIFECVGINGNKYIANITADGTDDFYLDLNTLYRNVVKEMQCSADTNNLYVMMKGGDWTQSTELVDWSLGVLGVPQHKVPVRMFTPEILTVTGAKLSKSLIREGDQTMDAVPKWIIDMGAFSEHFGVKYVERMISLCNLFLSPPRHTYRGYTWMEIIKILQQI